MFCRADGSPLDPSRLRRRFKTRLLALAFGRSDTTNLRHSFGTRMAAHPRISLRTLQEWMGHRDFASTLIYADYQPATGEAAAVEEAFASNDLSNDASDTGENSKAESVPE